jgi:hypothetical protein
MDRSSASIMTSTGSAIRPTAIHTVVRNPIRGFGEGWTEHLGQATAPSGTGPPHWAQSEEGAVIGRSPFYIPEG